MKRASFAKLGLVSKPPLAESPLRHLGDSPAVAPPSDTRAKDYFVERDGLRFAGRHLLVEFWQAEGLDDKATVEAALRDSISASGATLLHLHLHHFGANGGISGVAVLAESHISIHTWPERGYAAIDLFMCGGCDPYKAVPALRRRLLPGSLQISEQKRGILP